MEKLLLYSTACVCVCARARLTNRKSTNRNSANSNLTKIINFLMKLNIIIFSTDSIQLDELI